MLIAALTVGLCSIAASATPLASNEREARRAKILARIQQDAAKRAQDLLAATQGKAVRDFTNAALGVLVAGEDPKIAERLLDHAFSLQDMSRESPTFGYVPWTEGDLDIKLDPNSIEFATHSMGPILLVYGDKLSDSFKRRTKLHIKAAFEALRSHHPPVWYTNIFLMNTVNMLLMGQAVGDKKAQADGSAQLDTWLDYTRQAGIHEYDSPIYYGVDLDSLYIAYRLCDKPEVKAKLKAVLDLFWSDMCANYFPANKRLSGPQSRNYDFLGGAGGLSAFYWLEGLLDADPNGGSAYLYLGSGPEGYRPSADTLALASLRERVIKSTWDTKPGGDRYSYMTRDFVIGGASGYYEPQERPISVELASKKGLPVIVVIPDTFDSPYGKAKIIDACGHSKPFHWPLHPTCVQEKGTLMALLDLNPAGLKSWERGKRDEVVPVETLATNVILPAKADSILLDGKPVSTASPFKKKAKAGSVVGIREGKAGVAIRIFAAEGLHAGPGFEPRTSVEAEFVLQADKDGLESGALRYSVYHYRGEAMKLKEPATRVGLLISAAPCKTDADLVKLMDSLKAASIDDHVSRRSWQVRAKIGELSLEAGVDLAKREPLYRRVNGRSIQIERLMVNGADLALR